MLSFKTFKDLLDEDYKTPASKFVASGVDTLLGIDDKEKIEESHVLGYYAFGWIDPNGRIYDEFGVPSETHKELLRDNSSFKEEYQALAAGWVRWLAYTINSVFQLAFIMEKPQSATIKSIKTIVNRPEMAAIKYFTCEYRDTDRRKTRMELSAITEKAFLLKLNTLARSLKNNDNVPV